MKIICLGMIRSGSTLQFNLAKGVLTSVGAEVDELYRENVTRDDVLDITSRGGSVILKSHLIDPDALSDAINSGCRIVYTYRDLRDVYVSVRRMAGWSIEHFFEHVDQSIEQMDELSGASSTLLQKYESIYGDLPRATIEIAKFLNYELSDLSLSSIVDSVRVDSSVKPKLSLSLGILNIRNLLRRNFPSLMKGMNRYKFISSFKRSISSRLFGVDGSMMHKNHISKAKGASVWRDELSDEESGLIYSRYKKWFDGVGYEQ